MDGFLIYLAGYLLAFLLFARCSRKERGIPMQEWDSDIWFMVSVLSLFSWLGVLVFSAKPVFDWLTKERETVKWWRR